MKNKYRIVTDSYLGYEIQKRYWWFPFMYFQMESLSFRGNSYRTISEAASAICRDMKRSKVVWEGTIADEEI